jgi:hypothetical protein
MMEPISQRTSDDCVICALAMVMGPPYTYERVAEDRKKYQVVDEAGHALPWWESYLRDEGFQVERKTMRDLKFSDFKELPAGARALLVFKIPHMKIAHIVAIDEHGVIDPQVGSLGEDAEYQSVDAFREVFFIEEWKLYDRNFWVIKNERSI